MRYPLPVLPLICLVAVTSFPASAADFAGRPLLLSAEGGSQHAAWVAYENGEVLRCQADTGTCKAMKGLPSFATPVSLSAEPDQPAAWLGLSDGSLYRCSEAGRCAPITLPVGPGATARPPLR
jgi:hypothetical protein